MKLSELLGDHQAEKVKMYPFMAALSAQQRK